VVLIPALILAGVFAGGAKAQMYMPAYGSNGAPMSSFLSSSYLLQRASKSAGEVAVDRKGSATSATSAERSAGAPPVTFKSTGVTEVPTRLAAHYPADDRRQARETFVRFLEMYGDFARKFDLPRNDLAGAYATCVAGSWMAYRDRPFPDDWFPPLVKQIRSALSADASIAEARDRDKQELFEQMAIIGMFMATTQIAQSRQPDAAVAARMREAGASYLEQLLKVDASRVDFGPEGMRVQ